MNNNRKHEHLLSILIPVYNERAYLRRCVENILDAPLPEGVSREIVMVNDASTDGTDRLVEEIAMANPDIIRTFHQPHNMGKGAAVHRAIQEMRGDYAIFQDADLEYDPRDYQKILQPMLDGHADVVYGSRFASSEMRKILNYHHTLGNLFLTHMSNWFTGLNLTDMETCYKAFRADVLKTIPIRSNRFGVEPEITAKIAKRGCSIYEVPISYHGRSYAEGKKIGWKDGVSAIYRILKYWILDDCYDERYGHGILDSLSGAHKFCRWQVETIEPFLGDHILEVGSGIGNISRFLPKKQLLTVTDIDDVYLDLLDKAYCDNDLVTVEKLDLNNDQDFDTILNHQPDGYDSITCLNVLEHIEDDVAALKRMRQLLRSDGNLILLVPQHEWLYGSYDKHLDHFRRYSLAHAEKTLAKAGYRLKRTMSFNSLAVLGWYVNSVLLKRQTMSKYQIKIFDMLVPLAKVIESILPLPGVSLICIAEPG